MRRIQATVAGVGVVAVLAAGCADESPTEVGGDLLGAGVLTYEVVLEAHEFLLRDTTFNRIGTLAEAQFRLGAHQFEGELDARTLFRLNRPMTVGWSDEGVARLDTIASIAGGRMTLVIDSVHSTTGPVQIEILDVTESWHRVTTSWTMRADTGDAPLFWATPGGSPGDLVATATWSGGDSLVIAMDSAAVAVWADTADARMGGLVRVTTPGARLFIQTIDFRFDARPPEADTLIAVGSVGESRIIVTPEEAPPVEPGHLQVGGLPAWRAMFRFQPMDEVMIPCGPGTAAGCTVALGQVDINLASLLMTPVPAGPRRLERPVRMDPRAVLETQLAPLSRSPLTPPVGPPSPELGVALFDGSIAEPAPIPINVTNFVERSARPPADETRWNWLALTATGERGTFGYLRFGGMDSDRPPRLRLIVSAPVGELVQ